jgi:hypothetical protein
VDIDNCREFFDEPIAEALNLLVTPKSTVIEINSATLTLGELRNLGIGRATASRLLHERHVLSAFSIFLNK